MIVPFLVEHVQAALHSPASIVNICWLDIQMMSNIRTGLTAVNNSLNVAVEIRLILHGYEDPQRSVIIGLPRFRPVRVVTDILVALRVHGIGDLALDDSSKELEEVRMRLRVPSAVAFVHSTDRLQSEIFGLFAPRYRAATNATPVPFPDETRSIGGKVFQVIIPGLAIQPIMQFFAYQGPLPLFFVLHLLVLDRRIRIATARSSSTRWQGLSGDLRALDGKNLVPGQHYVLEG